MHFSEFILLASAASLAFAGPVPGKAFAVHDPRRLRALRVSGVIILCHHFLIWMACEFNRLLTSLSRHRMHRVSRPLLPTAA